MHLLMSIKDPSIVFFLVLSSVIAGIFLGVLFVQGVFLYGAIFLISICGGIIYAFFDGEYKVLCTLLIGIFLVLGVFLYHRANVLFSHELPHGLRTGTIVSNPIVTSYGHSFIVATTKNEKILVRSTDSMFFEYGNKITATLTCSRPKSFETDQGSIFDYARYLEKDHIYSVCKTTGPVVLQTNSSLQHTMYRFSNKLAYRIDELFKKPHNNFIGGILVGDKTDIDPTIRNDFIKTGTIHILALSGYNIAVVALFFQKLFVFFLRRRWALVCAGVSVVLFVAMTGFSASAIRAGIMALIVIMAQLTYQKYNALRALFFASFLMILYDPFYLLYDSSFHLSFLATYGIIALTPLLEYVFRRVTYAPVRTAITITLGAYIMTFPYLMFFFKGISISGIIVNSIIVPVIPALMLTSSLALVMSIVSLAFAFVASTISEWISQGILFFVHASAQISFGYIMVSISMWVGLLLYCLIFLGAYFLKKKIETAQLLSELEVNPIGVLSKKVPD